MRRTVIAVSLLSIAGLLNGCSRAKDEVLPDGTKYFGERKQWGGTTKAERLELPDGDKDFEVTWLKNGSVRIERIECQDGEKDFGETDLPDGTVRTVRVEFSDGQKNFDVTELRDGTQKIGRVEKPDGEKNFDETRLPDGTEKIGRVEFPSGEKHFDTTSLPDGTDKIGRVELPDGSKKFDVTLLPDGTETLGRAMKPDGTEIPTFSNVQNDEQGYADVKWGTAITDLDPSADGKSDSCFFSSRDVREDNEAVAAVFRVPTRDTVVAGTVLSTSLDFSVIPAKCKSVTKGDVKLIFYDDKLAMAFSHLNAHNYESIASEMKSKFTEMGGWSVNMGGGAMSDGDSTSLNARIFKRGTTNTRVVLLKRIDHEGIGVNVSSVYLLYVPNVDYLKIRGDIEKVKRDREAEAVAEQQKREQPDLQKIQ
jgi:hypothetical protein